MPADQPEPLHHRTFTNRTLRATRFVACDLGDVTVRGSYVDGLDIDSPWLCEGPQRLLVNGVDVAPLVDAELDRRLPGRSLRRASTAAGLRDAWTAVEDAWAGTLAAVAPRADEVADASVDGEWSLAQTLRHLVHATDLWLLDAVLGAAEPHPLALAPEEEEAEGAAPGTVTAGGADPSWDAVLAARLDRQDRVRSFLGEVSDHQLTEPRSNPHDAEQAETVLSCLRTILEEEWEHLRFVRRDLAALGHTPVATLGA